QLQPVRHVLPDGCTSHFVVALLHTYVELQCLKVECCANGGALNQIDGRVGGEPVGGRVGDARAVDGARANRRGAERGEGGREATGGLDAEADGARGRSSMM